MQRDGRVPDSKTYTDSILTALRLRSHLEWRYVRMLLQEINHSFDQLWTLTLDLLEGDDSGRHVPRMVPCLGRADSESRRRQDADKETFEYLDRPRSRR